MAAWTGDIDLEERVDMGGSVKREWRRRRGGTKEGRKEGRREGRKEGTKRKKSEEIEPERERERRETRTIAVAGIS